jgi:Cyclophilin-like family
VSSSLPTSLHLTVNGNAVKARLVDSPTTRDFIRLLPLMLPMTDLFDRVQFGICPARSRMRESLRIAIIVIGRVTSGIEAFGLRGAATVRFELSDHDASSRQSPIPIKRSGEQS